MINRPNQSDINALQHGLKNRSPARTGLRLYTADFDSISMANFYRGRSAFLMLSGPSLNQLDLSLLNQRGIVTMGVNNAWTIHRPTLWTCVDDPGRFIDTGWKDPGITKFVPVCHRVRRLRIQKPDDRRYAFDEARAPNVIRYNNTLYESLTKRFEALLPHFEQHKFRVVNCSPGSALSVFERMSYEDAIKQAASECSKPIITTGWYTPVTKAN